MSPIQAISAEHERLQIRRDHAAYAVVGCLEQAIHYCRREEPQYALDTLTRAKIQYEQADTDLENFKRANAQHFNRKPQSAAQEAA